MLKAVGKKIILKAVEESKKGSLFLPGIKPVKFVVMDTGEDVDNIAVGDVVYLDKHHGAELEHEGEKFLVIEESAILAVVD
jgi:co-chaperonin GroES (HSP10)